MITIGTIRDFLFTRRGTRGATAVEFALVSPVFLFFVLGVIDFGRLFWVKNLMQYSAEQTARYAMVTPTASASDLQTFAENESSGLYSGISYSVSSETLDGIEYRIISASNSFEFLTPLVNSNLALAAKARTPINAL